MNHAGTKVFTDKIDDVRMREMCSIIAAYIASRTAAVDWTGVEALAAVAAELGFVDRDGVIVGGLAEYLQQSLGAEHVNYRPAINILQAAGRARDVTDLNSLTVHVDVEVTEGDIADGIQGNCDLCALALALQRAVGIEVHVHVTGTMAYLDGFYHCWLPAEVKTFISLFDNNSDNGVTVKPFKVHLIFIATGPRAIPEEARCNASRFRNDATPTWSYWIETDGPVLEDSVRAHTLAEARQLIRAAHPNDIGADGEVTGPGGHSFPVFRK